jgi:hypothetical protein
VSRYQLLQKDSHRCGWLVVLAKQNGRMDILSAPCMQWNDLTLFVNQNLQNLLTAYNIIRGATALTNLARLSSRR